MSLWRSATVTWPLTCDECASPLPAKVFTSTNIVVRLQTHHPNGSCRASEKIKPLNYCMQTWTIHLLPLPLPIRQIRPTTWCFSISPTSPSSSSSSRLNKGIHNILFGLRSSGQDSVMFPQQQSLKELLNKKKNAFRDSDRDLLKSIKRELKVRLRESSQRCSQRKS